MTKEEKIKEAYGKHWELTNGNLNDDYSFDFIGSISDYDLGFNFKIIFTGISIFRAIPFSIIGIENNNGWIKIESESDLPEQGGEYVVFRMSKKSTATYCKNDRWMITENDYPKTTFQHGITHYRKKEIIPNPIY